MGLNENTNTVLQFLFDEYMSNPGALVDISKEIRTLGKEPFEFGKYLVDSGLVKNHQYRPQGFVCSISTHGIETIAPEYFSNAIEKVISTIGTLGFGRHSIMEILDLEAKDFSRAFDIAKYLEDRGVIKQGQYVAQDVIIELSFEAQEQYNDAFNNI